MPRFFLEKALSRKSDETVMVSVGVGEGGRGA
jgi:hypothetical protein